MSFFWRALIVLGALLAAASASAQSEPKITASIDPASVEVGEPCTVVINVSVDAGAASPSDPRLALPAGFRASPPSVSTQTQISIVNGRFTRTTGISATWQVVAPSEGVFVVGPPSVLWNGQRLSARPLRLTVHPAGSGRSRSRQRPTNPFDPFGMLPRLPGLFDTPDPFEPAPPEPAPDPELALDFAPDSKVFLRSIVDKTTPVVGEQVTLTVFVYSRVSALELTDPHEPSIPDFFRRDLIAPHTQPDPRGVSIRGVPWRVQAIYKGALFPLRSGELEIGAMQATIVGRALNTGAGLRSSEPIKLRVSEPPAQGRPIGYQIGDVGSYTLGASVEPRVLEVGGALAVNVTVSGVGNVPSALPVPSSSSFEWLEPEVREKIDVDGGKVKGSRSFSYVVRPKLAGNLDLGQIALPYWNPERRAYEVARAALGNVRVTAAPALSASAAAAAASAAPRDPWAAIGHPREHLTAYPRAQTPLTDRRWYWMALFGAPLIIALGALGERGARRLSALRVTRRASRERGALRALAEARAADARGAPLELAGGLDRAIHLAIEEATGLKARALLITELPTALEQRGVATELSRAAGELLGSIDAARFLPDQSGSLRELLPRVEGVVRTLLQSARNAAPPPVSAPSRVSVGAR